MAKQKKNDRVPLRPVIGDEWPDGLEVIEEKEQPEPTSERHGLFVVNEIFRLATCVILVLLGYSLAKADTPALSRFGDRAWWIVIGLLAGTMIGRPALARIMDMWKYIEKHK